MNKRDINYSAYRSGIACFGGIPDENHWYIKVKSIQSAPVCQFPPRKSTLRKFAEKRPEDQGETAIGCLPSRLKPCL